MEQMFVDVGDSMIYLIVRLVHQHMQLVKVLSDDEMHIVVFDRTGDISGFRKDTAGERTNSVLETYAFVLQHPNAKTPQGGTNYYPDVIFKQSSFVYWLDHDVHCHLVLVQDPLLAGTSGRQPVGTGSRLKDSH